MVYAVIHSQNTGVVPYQIRLLYVNEAKPEAILSKNVDIYTLNKTKEKIISISSSIDKSLKNGIWPTKKQVLCDWCPFKQICPEFSPGLEGLLPEELLNKIGHVI